MTGGCTSANLGAEEVVPLDRSAFAQGLSSAVVGDVARNLPAALSSFVGREREMTAVAKLLGSARLVTLTGTAGVGKTRLAMEVALSVARGYANGVWLVELGPVADPDLVPAAVTAVLGVREQPGQPLTETLVSHLCHRRLLLMLDNCEHVINAAAALAEALLRACRDLCLLTTSREALGLVGEAAWPVPSLSVPPVGDALLSLGAYEAVCLFVERAVATAPSFALTPAVGPSVAEICRRLDGIPLAIELAASRVAVLTPAQIAARLDDRFALLTGGGRTASPRQQTLLATLEWSHDLLSDLERMLLRRLSVFAGGCTLEAVEQVCAGGGLEPRQVLDLLAGLVAKSLVVADTSGAKARYRLLESIRELGAAKLAEAEEEQALHERHAAWCMGLAELAEPELTGAQQVAWLERLEAEHANLRAALRWSLNREDHDQGMRLAAALTLFWWVRGYLSEGRDWFDRVLSADSGADTPRALRAKALWGAGWMAGLAGDFGSALAAAKESLALARQVGDLQGAARALHLLGGYAEFQDPVAARPLFQESVALARQAGDRWCLAGALGLLGFAECFQGECAAGRVALEECLAVARDGHDKQGLRMGLIGLGYVALEEGEYGSAEAFLQEGLAVARELADPFWTGLALLYLGELARARGAYRQARTLMENGLALIRECGYRWITAVALLYLARVAQAEGDLDDASHLFQEALPIAQTSGNKRIVALVFLGLGDWSQILGDLTTARARFEEALGLARDCGAKHLIAESLYRLGALAQSQGDHERAETLHHEALRLGGEIGRSPSVAASLEALAGLAALQGRSAYAVRLFGAAHSLRDARAGPRSPAEQPDYDRAIALVQEGLSPEEFTDAWEQGAVLSMVEAVAYASKGRGPRQRPSTGWASLTDAERNVVRLVAEGLTNREIGERLFISWRTVQAHLSHVFAKLGVTSRRQLAREAYRQGME